jgi:fructokinase
VSAGELIVVAGEALVDLVSPGDGTLAAHPGGGPFNTARALGRLERPVAYLGRVSTDAFGEQQMTLLESDGVRLDGIVRTGDLTELALAELDASGDARYRFYDQGTAAPGLTPDAALGALPDGVGYLHVGTLGPEPLAAALEALAERLAGSALVMVDPNCRPDAIADEETYHARIRRVIAVSDVVKVSGDDLAFLAPGAAPEQAARDLLDDGPAVVLLTLGEDGAVVITRDGERRVPPVEVDVADTIGAGDAFSGGWLAWWSERGLGVDELADGEAVAEATRHAARVAALTCAKPGASPPYRREL